MRKIKAFFLLAFLMLTAVSVSAQCSMCKAVAESGSEADGARSIGEQLNSGIILLMIIPYVILFFLFRKKIKSFWNEFRQIHK